MAATTYNFDAYQGNVFLGTVKAASYKAAFTKAKKLWVHTSYINGPPGAPKT